MATKSLPDFGLFRAGCLVLLTLFCLLDSAVAADTNVPPAADSKTAESDAIGAQDFLRSYLQLQEEVHETQMAIQKIQQETVARNASNSAAVEDRLRSMEKTIADEHTEQLSGIAHLDRTILIAAGTFSCIGFLVLLLAAFLQWSALHRMPPGQLAVSRSGRGPDPHGALPPPVQALEQSNIRLLELIDRLEERIHDLETSTQPPKALADGAAPPVSTAESRPEEISPPAGPDKTGTIHLLINKSQTLLKLDKAEAALNCIDEALALDADNTDALVKKGAVLEHLQRVPEAIECYDRAIALDSSTTMAYLRKGSLFTRFERHGEALACYEQALKSGKIPRREMVSLEQRISSSPNRLKAQVTGL